MSPHGVNYSATSNRDFPAFYIKVFGQKYSEFGGKTNPLQTFKLHINDLKTRVEVLTWYIQMNAGGTPHTDEEIDRVRELIRQS